jgi:hypothetical protein
MSRGAIIMVVYLLERRRTHRFWPVLFDPWDGSFCGFDRFGGVGVLRRRGGGGTGFVAEEVGHRERGR